MWAQRPILPFSSSNLFIPLHSILLSFLKEKMIDEEQSTEQVAEECLNDEQIAELLQAEEDQKY